MANSSYEQWLDGTVLVLSEGWESAEGEGRTCRQKHCGRPAVMRLFRSDKHWWYYCDQHLYGHVVLEDGVYHPRPLADALWMFEAVP